jgi:hypothetical protein
MCSNLYHYGRPSHGGEAPLNLHHCTTLHTADAVQRGGFSSNLPIHMATSTAPSTPNAVHCIIASRHVFHAEAAQSSSSCSVDDPDLKRRSHNSARVQGQRARDDKCCVLDSARVTRVSVIQRFKRRFRIYLQLAPDERVAILAAPSLAIAALKRTIERERGIPFDEQRLYSSPLCSRISPELCDNHTLGSCRVRSEHTLYLEQRRRGVVALEVLLLDGGVKTIEVPEASTIAAVKAIVAGSEEQESSVASERLYIAHHYASAAKLHDNFSLAECGIQHKSKIRMIAYHGWHVPLMQVHVSLPGSAVCDVTTLDARPCDTVASLMTKIHHVLGCDPRLQTIRAKNSLSSYDRPSADVTLFGANIDHGESLEVSLKTAHSSVEFIVKCLSGRDIQIEASSFTTIEAIKDKLQLKAGALPEQQRLIFGARQLENGYTLADYDISSGSTVHLVLRFRGGMFHETSTGRRHGVAWDGGGEGEDGDEDDSDGGSVGDEDADECEWLD